MLSPELTTKVIQWRAKSNEGTLSLDEMKQAIILLRGGRVTAAQASTKSKSKKAPARSADDLLSDLGV